MLRLLRNGRTAQPAVGGTKWFPLAALLLLPIFVVVFSVWQGTYNLDPHHWGLMLSNAKDLSLGKMPYKDIFIQYGFLTTLIHAAAYALLGENLRSLIGITAIAYAAGLVGIYHLSLVITTDKRLAIFSFISACLLHSVAIYPWSNYIAFPFLVYGAWFLFSPETRRLNAFLSGLFFALAVLSREGLLPAVLIFVMITSIVNSVRVTGKRADARREIGFLWLGLALPLAVFFTYLQSRGLMDYWYKTSVLLPRLYADEFMKDGVLASILGLAKYFLRGLLALNNRIIFFGLVVLASMLIALGFLAGRKVLRQRSDIFLLAVFTLLLLSSSLHLNEIFRLATSITIGIVLLYWVASRYKLENKVFVLFSVLLVFTVARNGNGNYFIPSREVISVAVAIDTPSEFKGQEWSEEARNYYKFFQRDMNLLKTDDCGIHFHHNATRDAFLAVLSPFMQYQLAPFGRGVYNMDSWEQLRPEFDVKARIEKNRDIVLFSEISSSAFDSYEPPSGYVVARRYLMPKSYFFPQGDIMLIMVPTTCTKFLPSPSQVRRPPVSPPA